MFATGQIFNNVESSQVTYGKRERERDTEKERQRKLFYLTTLSVVKILQRL